jgi:cytochrome c
MERMSLWNRSGIVLAISLSSLLLIGAGPQEKKENGDKPAAKGDAAKGKEVFQANCDICHNADSTEDKVGPGLKGLWKKPPHKMSDGTEHKQHTVAMVRKQIVEGGGSMPPVGAALSAKEVDDLMAYLQTL